MEPLDFRNLPEDALVLIDSAPIIYFLEGHTKFGPRFKPLFEAHGTGRLRFAVTTITIAEVLTGPLQAGDDALVQRYRAILESWQPITLAVAAFNFLKAQHVDVTIVHETLSSLRGVAMSSIGTKLLNSLRSIERPGDFCVGGIREIVMPTIDIDGVGRIDFPILPVQAERLAAIAEAAPYGRGEKTVVDREVRRTWQVDSAKVRIGGRHWDKTLASLVADIALGLGVSEPVAAEFYKLLVYDTGSFFVDHRDTEKVPGMFATMVLACV